MTVTCPEGHQSEASDYCDICGTPIAAGLGAGSPGSAAAGPGGSSTPGPVIPQAVEGSVLDLGVSPAVTLTCPHCSAPNVADALFCEACGYDFTTGAVPLGSEPAASSRGEDAAAVSALDLTAGVADDESDVETEAEAADDAVGDTADEATDDPGDADAHAGDDVDTSGDADGEADDSGDTVDEAVGEPVAVAAEPVAGPDSDDADVDDADDADADDADADDAEADDPEADEKPVADASTSEGAVAAHVRPRHTPPSRDLADTWVVEVWIDPDWYAVQQTEEVCPSPGLPDVVVVRRNVILIGRPSGSLAVRPDVDAGSDSAVSRRHAQLTSDGSRWWIEDLGSSNGTYVGSVGEPLPTQPISQRVEIDRDDRIYVGAWTRLVVRQATASEQAGQG